MYDPTHYVVHDDGDVVAWFPMTESSAEARAQAMAKDLGFQVEYAKYVPPADRGPNDGPWFLNGTCLSCGGPAVDCRPCYDAAMGDQFHDGADFDARWTPGVQS